MSYFTKTLVTYPTVPNIYTHEYAAMDVDGDGDLDIVCARFGMETGTPLLVLLNDGNGGFIDGTSTIFPSGAPLTVHPRGIAIADYNGDGRQDLFIADHGYDAPPYPGAQNALLLSSGAHGFVNATDRLPQLSDYSHSTAAGDIDGDGDVDILVMNTHGGTPSTGSLTNPYILVNDGGGHFVRHDDLLPASVSARDFGSKYTSCLFFDADGDGDQDLVVGAHGGESATNYSRILYNDGTGIFSDDNSIDLPVGPWSPTTAGAVALRSADLNGDGQLDLIVDLENAYAGHYIQLLINHGPDGFVDETAERLPQSTENDGNWIHSIYPVDLNGDGYLDLIARNGQYPPIFLNDGSGNFVNLPGSFLDYEGWGTPQYVSLVPIDANGDSRTDLLADFSDGRMFLFTQRDPGLSQTGTDAGEALLGDASAETLRGMGGDDVIFAAAGNDSVDGGAGDDYLNGGDGADRLVGLDGHDVLNGGAGIDVMRGGLGNDTYYVDNLKDIAIENSGEGTDRVFSSVSLALGSNIENLIITGGAIRGNGNSLANTITGTSGNNIIDGGAGADVMRGGLGDDRYYVDNAADRPTEGASAGRDRVYTTVSLTLGANLEDLFARSSDPLNLTGNGLDNVLRGNSAANVLTGGAGADDNRGGTDADTFVFRDGDFAGLTPSTSDRIIDFSHAEGDRIDLAGVDANSGATFAGDQAFAFIGTAAFSHTAGELRYQVTNGNTYLTGDTDGDGAADFMVRLDGAQPLVAGDFVL